MHTIGDLTRYLLLMHTFGNLIHPKLCDLVPINAYLDIHPKVLLMHTIGDLTTQNYY